MLDTWRERHTDIPRYKLVHVIKTISRVVPVVKGGTNASTKYTIFNRNDEGRQDRNGDTNLKYQVNGSRFYKNRQDFLCK